MQNKKKTMRDSRSETLKTLLQPLFAQQYDYNLSGLKSTSKALFTNDAQIHIFNPFGHVDTYLDFLQEVLEPLFIAMPNAERRDTIIMAGDADQNTEWVGACGYFTGTFTTPFLDIPPTQRMASIRFHEFYKFIGDQVSEIHILWDLPELMMQAGVWPLAPSLGREWHVPGPARQDGLVHIPMDGQASLQLVSDMCAALGNFAEGGVAAMRLEDYWHPKFSWYGPSGIGTGQGIAGFRKHHQIPFLNGLPDRVGDTNAGYLFAEDAYVGFTAWPGMHMSVGGDGWLGIAPAGQKITMRSLDFWRCEDGTIRENWVLIDLIHVYDQLGVDVFKRMREMS